MRDRAEDEGNRTNGEAQWPDRDQLDVEVLASGGHRSPCANPAERPADRVLLSALVSTTTGVGPSLPSFEVAGPRAELCRSPKETTLGLVTCGGLCPGVNDVIRAVTMTALRRYGVRRVIGFRYGFAGLADPACEPLELDADVVDGIHLHGGTLLGSSRGPQDVAAMVHRLAALDVSGLVCVGGDGTLRGAASIHAAARRLGIDVAVVAVPKTIDNDLQWVERSFGFATGVQEAGRAIAAAHAEARGARNGVGLVKLMGRHSGFIAAHATLAFPDVNLCLVPEVPFGPERLLDVLEARLSDRGHAVIVVAEGAAQELAADGPCEFDASGNVRLADVGTWLRDHIGRGLVHRGVNATVKYIDPSYAIRSCPASAVDAEFCAALGMHAVHAALAGRTNVMIGYWNQHFTHVPIGLAVGQRRQVDPDGEVWQRVLHSTGQPAILADTTST